MSNDAKSSEKAWDERLDAETKRMRLLTAGFAGGLANMLLMIGAVVGGRGPEKIQGWPVFFFFVGAMLFLRGFLRSVEFNRLTMNRSRDAFQAALHKEEMDNALTRIQETSNDLKKKKLETLRAEAEAKYKTWSEKRDSFDEPRENIYTWMERNLRIAIFYAVMLILIMLTEPGRGVVADVSRWWDTHVVCAACAR